MEAADPLFGPVEEASFAASLRLFAMGFGGELGGGRGGGPGGGPGGGAGDKSPLIAADARDAELGADVEGQGGGASDTGRFAAEGDEKWEAALTPTCVGG